MSADLFCIWSLRGGYEPKSDYERVHRLTTIGIVPTDCFFDATIEWHTNQPLKKRIVDKDSRCVIEVCVALGMQDEDDIVAIRPIVFVPPPPVGTWTIHLTSSILFETSWDLHPYNAPSQRPSPWLKISPEALPQLMTSNKTFGFTICFKLQRT